MTQRIYFLLFFLFCSVTCLYASTGKIAGRVIDSKTKEPVIGASVLIEGTRQGASTDLEGRYTIINVPPGNYTLRVSSIGYSNSVRTNVQVSIDLTSRQDFDLIESIIESDEVIVIAEKPLIRKDLTASTAVVGAEQLQTLPVTEFSQILNLQAGYVGGHVRGGRSGEVGYWIDGIPVTDAYDGSNVVEVNKDMIQELQLVSGAFNAEYGQAMSGIVNIATKEGGNEFHGSVSTYIGDYVSTHKDIFKGIDEINPVNIRNFEGSLNGPIVKDLSFFANARYIYFGGWLNGIRRFTPENYVSTSEQGETILYTLPSGKGDSSIVPMNWSERVYLQGKLNYRLSSLIRLSYSIIYDNRDYQDYSRSYQYNPDGNLNRFSNSLTNILQLNHSVSSMSFYTLGVSYFKRKYEHYLYEDPYDPRYVHPDLTSTLPYSFMTGGTDLSRFQRETETLLGKLDFTTQLNHEHLIKFGFEGRLHQLKYEDITLRPIESQTDFNSLPTPYIQTRILDESSMYNSHYTKKPIELSFYLQDKMEFNSLIINIGVRFDYFNSNGKVLVDESDPNIFEPIKPSNRFNDLNGNGIQDPGETTKTVADREAYWYKDAKSKFQISPRFGASFPITDKGVIHFSYGHFFQIPRFELLYQNPFFKLGSGTGNLGIVGNADLNPEMTINGEVGLQQQLTDDISVDVTAYFRDVRDLSGTRADEIVLFGGSATYNKYVNSDFGFIKGFIISLSKRFSGGFAATLDYTFQVANGSASNPQESRNAIAGGSLPEVQLTPLAWDQRHTANATVSYNNRGWGGSVIAQYGSGFPYTPRRSEDITSLITNSQIKPASLNVDVRFHKELKLGPLNSTIFLRVFNLFDNKNENGVYDDTGRAGFTTDEERLRRTGVKETVNTISDWFTNASFYSEPRRIELGLIIEF